MKLSTKLAFVVTFLLSFAAHAQVISAYVLSANTHFSNVQTGSVYTNGSYTNQYTSFFASGIGGGVTLNFLPVGPVKLGIDLRGSTKPGTTGADTGMVGLRVGFKPPLLKVKPFAQVSGGYLATRTNNVSTVFTGGNTSQAVGGTFGNQYAAYEILGGVDFPLLPLIDFRIEAGGGHGFNVGLSNSTTNNVNFFSIDPGLVVHF